MTTGNIVVLIATKTSNIFSPMPKKSFSNLHLSGSPDKLQRFIANLPGMACQIQLDTDNTLHFPYVSEGCFALLGITAREIKQQPRLMLDMLHPKDSHAFYKSMQESAARSTPWNWEGRIVLPFEGGIKWVNLRVSHCSNSLHGTIWEGLIVNITQNKLAEQEIKTSRQRLRELSSHIETIIEEERIRIAREIHDGIGVLLTVLKMDLVWLMKRMPQGDNALHEKSQAMSNMLGTASSAASNLAHSLHPSFLDVFGIATAITIEAKEFTKRTGIPCNIVKSDEDIEVPAELSIVLFRVFQEALHNIMKHASAEQVQVQIKINKVEKYIGLFVADDGKGFDQTARNKPYSFGLRSIQERIKHLGGDVRITSELGKGTQIAVCMTLDGTKCSFDSTDPQQTLF